MEPGLYSELQFFRTAGEVFAREGGLGYPPLVAGYRSPIGSTADEPDQAHIFAPFAGTEGYNPVAYIPYIAAAAIGRLFKLDFSDMLLFMRWFGLATFTAIAAYAIAVIPTLKWAFVLIALLPVSLYNRSVLSADGAALSTALVITALCLRAAAGSTVGRVWERSLWMTLCALSKQPQIVFLLLELMVYRVKELPRQWLRISSVVLPSVILSPMWVVLVSAEVGAWRLQEEGHHPPEHFDPLWKLFYMWEHPYHFPLAVWRAVSGWGDRLWQELVGIVGWQDILLPTWTYLVLTALLFLVPLLRVGAELLDRLADLAAATGDAIKSQRREILEHVHRMLTLVEVRLRDPHEKTRLDRIARRVTQNRVWASDDPKKSRWVRKGVRSHD